MEKLLQHYSLYNAIQGGLIYATGDTLASVLTEQFQIQRMLGIFLVGASIYALEINSYFAWLDRRFEAQQSYAALKRGLMAQAYFNPLWIARHLAIILVLSGHWQALDWSVLALGLKSFMHALPFALLMNYLIQNTVPLRWRFPASALMSASMAVYYALSEVLFG